MLDQNRDQYISEVEATVATAQQQRPCPPIRALLDYLFNVMSCEERRELESHLASCPKCHRELEGLRIGAELFFEQRDLQHSHG
jgi:hypothetical protein